MYNLNLSSVFLNAKRHVALGERHVYDNEICLNINVDCYFTELLDHIASMILNHRIARNNQETRVTTGAVLNRRRPRNSFLGFLIMYLI